MKKRLVVGLSGASGAILCVSLLEAMRKEKDWEVHLVTSEAGERVLREETGMSGTDLAGLARTHDIATSARPSPAAP
ncbi:MAG: flavoprotein [Bilophila wadsworthia]